MQYFEAGIFECTLGGFMLFFLFGGGVKDEMLAGLYSIRLWLPLQF